jgi:uncharacterized integral membrane protein (TIGR00697 family)
MSTKVLIPLEKIGTPKYSSYLIFLSMLYICLLFTTAVLTSKIIKIGGTITLAGTVIIPLWFVISDIISEVYGADIAKKIMCYGFACQFIFAVLCTLLIYAPYPQTWHGQNAYEFVLGPLLRISILSVFSFIISGYINIKLISKWKILLKGKYFWLRCLGASTIAELIFTILAVVTMQYHKISTVDMIKIICTSYTIKVISSVIFAFPASIAVYLLKKAENIPPDEFTESIFNQLTQPLNIINQ